MRHAAVAIATAAATDLWETDISLHTRSQLNTGSIFNLWLHCSQYEISTCTRTVSAPRRSHTHVDNFIKIVRLFQLFRYFSHSHWLSERVRCRAVAKLLSTICASSYSWNCVCWNTSTYLTWPKIVILFLFANCDIFFYLSFAFPTYHFSCWLVTCLVP